MSEAQYSYRITITGKINAVDRAAAEQKLRMFISLPFGIMDGVEEMNVVAMADLDDMGSKFK